MCFVFSSLCKFGIIGFVFLFFFLLLGRRGFIGGGWGWLGHSFSLVPFANIIWRKIDIGVLCNFFWSSAKGFGHAGKLYSSSVFWGGSSYRSYRVGRRVVLESMGRSWLDLVDCGRLWQLSMVISAYLNNQGMGILVLVLYEIFQSLMACSGWWQLAKSLGCMTWLVLWYPLDWASLSSFGSLLLFLGLLCI